VSPVLRRLAVLAATRPVNSPGLQPVGLRRCPPGGAHNGVVTQWVVPGDLTGSELECPRCGGPSDLLQHGTSGELSRWDQVSVICSSCATHEAMLLVKDRRSLHPVTGRRPWYRKPISV
jgi:hypothetical protein